MASSKSRENPPAERGPVGSFLWGLYRFLASLQLAVVLIVVLTVVLAVATVLESGYGTEYVQWFVYDHVWFIGLLGLLATNILAATLVRFPWGRRRIGFVITHAGILVLLAGAIQTYVSGIEGQVTLEEGKSTDEMMMADWSLFAVYTSATSKDEKPAKLIFQPGPADWPADKTLDLGKSEKGVSAEVLAFYRHGRFVKWVEDEENSDGSVIRLAILSSDGESMGEEWLEANPMAQGLQFGRLGLALLPAAANTMREDFLNPPAGDPPNGDLSDKGVLSVHFQGKMQRVPVDENIGKKVPLGAGGASLEIARYLPDARAGANRRFDSASDEPNNPMLELFLHLPGADEPLQQVSFAKYPGLSIEAMHGRRAVASFWYHHPAVAATTGVQFLQTPDEALYARVGTEGKYHSQRQVQAGDDIRLPMGLKVRIAKHYPHARNASTFEPVKLDWGEKDGPEAAAKVRFTVGDKSETIWLQRNTPQRSYQRLQIGTETVELFFGYRLHPMGFSVELLDFKHGRNPGGTGSASFASKVRLVDKRKRVDQKHEISMNAPATHGRYTLYQSSFDPSREDVSTLSVTYDPGRFLKYSGSLTLCVGIFVMYYLRKRRPKKTP